MLKVALVFAVACVALAVGFVAFLAAGLAAVLIIG